MTFTFRPVKIWPEDWPNAHGRSCQFSANYSKTLEQLDNELWHLDATDVILQVDATERDCRLDGQLRADAKVGYRGVILSFVTPKFGTLTYPCDTFEGVAYKNIPGWQANLRAITLGLESLRTVERYGIADRGQQYAGYAELPSGIALGSAMTVDEAAEFIGEHAEWQVPFDPTTPSWVASAFRVAAKKLHPDHGGDPDLFRKLIQAKDLLEAQ